jgi:hypothetical protein
MKVTDVYKSVYVKKEIDLKKYMIDYDTDDYAALTGELPVNQFFFHVTNCGIAGLTSQNNRCQMRITYQAEFFDPQIPALS